MGTSIGLAGPNLPRVTVGVAQVDARTAFTAAASRTDQPSAPQRSWRQVFGQAGAGVEIYASVRGRDVLMRRTGDIPSVDAEVNIAFNNATKFNEYISTRFGRNGWDNRGTSLKMVVHQPNTDGTPLNNAYWDARAGKIYLGDGDGTLLVPLGRGLDVVAHEATHAMIDSEVHLPYEGQSGALHESFADVVAAAVDPDWLIGEDVFTPGTKGDALRNMERPTYGHTKDIPAWQNEVHELSGVPSKAAVNVAKSIGRDAMVQIWYRALTEHLGNRSGFAGAARATLEAARDLHGETSSQFAAVRDAWKAVGVDARWSSSK